MSRQLFDYKRKWRNRWRKRLADLLIAAYPPEGDHVELPALVVKSRAANTMLLGCRGEPERPGASFAAPPAKKPHSILISEGV